MVMQEDPELNSSQGHTESIATYGTITSEKILKLADQLLHISKQENNPHWSGRRG